MKQVFNITTEWNRDPEQETLSVRLGERHVGFAISNHEGNELFQLSWYAGDEVTHHELDELYLNHPEFRNSFSRIMVSYDHPRSILVPPGSYTENDPKLLLDIMYGANGKSTILKENVTSWQLQNVYAVPAEIQDWMARHFPSAVYRHSYSIGIKQISTTDFDGGLLVDFRTNDFTLIASKASRLLLTQTFSYTTPDDVLYYLVKVCKELSFTQETARVALSGLVEKESNLYRELDQFFLNIRFREPSWQIHAATEQEFPPHFFTSLNDLALCVS